MLSGLYVPNRKGKPSATYQFARYRQCVQCRVLATGSEVQQMVQLCSMHHKLHMRQYILESVTVILSHVIEIA